MKNRIRNRMIPAVMTALLALCAIHMQSTGALASESGEMSAESPGERGTSASQILTESADTQTAPDTPVLSESAETQTTPEIPIPSESPNTQTTSETPILPESPDTPPIPESPIPTEPLTITPLPTPTEAPMPSETPTPTATPTPAPEIHAAFSLALRTDREVLKAGSQALYEVVISNEGNVPLEEISLESRFSCPKIVREWEAAADFVPGPAEGVGILHSLQPGEQRTLYLHAQLTQEQSKRITHTVTARAISPGSDQETVLREAAVETDVEPLKIDFAVEKTADRAIAMPGDVITYWICIRNTGERTLHSVASTERFVGSDIPARFEEQEGVILNGSGTQALISQIAPGSAVNLKATVLVPAEAAGQELINEVVVSTEETKDHTLRARSSVIVGVPEEETEETIPENQTDVPSQEIWENPKTGDRSPTGLLIGLMISVMASSGLLAVWRKKRR